MPKVSKETVTSGSRDYYVSVTFILNVNSEGMFNCTLSAEDVNMLKTYGIKFGTNGRRNSREGYFVAPTKAGVINQVKGVLDQCMTRTVKETKIIIQYAINTTCSFWFSKEGAIIPNGSWYDDGTPDTDRHWQNGTEMTHATHPEPTGIKFYVKPIRRTIYVFGNGKELVEENILSPFGGSSFSKEQYYLRWLEAICSTRKPDRAELKELDYTEDRAKFFVEFYKSLCKLSHSLNQLNDLDSVIKFIETGKLLTM